MAAAPTDAFLEQIPKVELHLHIEGSLEPEMLFALAQRNSVKIPFGSVEEIRAAYAFTNLQTFLDIYYQGMSVLLHEQDFYDLTYAYFKRVHADNVRHAELFFDPQGHTDRGVAFDTVVNGIYKGMQAAEKDFGVTSKLIISILRHLSEEEAFKTFEQAKPHMDKFVAVGLDSSEVGHPPEKFEKVFAAFRAAGLKAVAHAGEEGPPEYIWGALDCLKVSRIDHGVRSLEDPKLVARLIEEKVCLTVCPLSNTALKVYSDMADHPMKKILDAGICGMINSDDPAYFGGYMNDNFKAVVKGTGMTKENTVTACKHGINGTFLDDAGKAKLMKELDDFVAASQ
jgi:adenosine deaminase